MSYTAAPSQIRGHGASGLLGALLFPVALFLSGDVCMAVLGLAQLNLFREPSALGSPGTQHVILPSTDM